MTTYSPLTDVLTNGAWVRRGMVWHWRPGFPAAPQPRTYRPRDLIACPRCLARMDEQCKGARGREHSARLVKRVCPCGGSLRPREQICGWCRAEASLAERNEEVAA